VTVYLLRTMSGVLCTWAANVPEASEQWYEENYIPAMTSKLSQQSLHCEVNETGLDTELDGVGEREAPWKWLTVYEMEDTVSAAEAMYDESNHPAMTGGLELARFDVRLYEEIQRWQQGDWQGGKRIHVSSSFSALLLTETQIIQKWSA
jgi:hypothetical protein